MKPHPKQKIVPHPGNPEQGYIIGGGEYCLSLSANQREEVAEIRDAGFEESDVAQFVAELALNEMSERSADRALNRATRVREDFNEKLQQSQTESEAKQPTRKPIVFNRGRKERNKAEKHQWDAIHIDGVTFEPTVHRVSDNRSRTAVEWDAPSRRVMKKFGMEEGENIKVSYQKSKEGNQAIFEGMKVPRGDRFNGRGLGVALFKHWRTGIEEQGMQFGGTTVIRKPSIAKTLAAAGLKPYWKKHETPLYGVLLPQDLENPRAASVYVDGSQDEVMEAIKQSEAANKKHTFYDVITTKSAKEILESRRPGEDWDEYCATNRVPLNARWQDPPK